MADHTLVAADFGFADYYDPTQPLAFQCGTLGTEFFSLSLSVRVAVWL